MLESNKNGVTQDYDAEMQNFISKYADTSNPALGMLSDTIRKDIEKNLPGSCMVATRMSEDNNILSVDIVQVNPDSSEKPWINRDLDECIDSCE